MPTVKDPPTELPPAPLMISEQQLELHRVDMARRQAELDANRPELMKCLNPKYAAKREAEKQSYRWTVKATWHGIDDGEQSALESEQVVIAQNEADAWAAFCDKIERWPSPRDATREFIRGRKVTVAELVTLTTEDENHELPRKKIGPAAKARKL